MLEFGSMRIWRSKTRRARRFCSVALLFTGVFAGAGWAQLGDATKTHYLLSGALAGQAVQLELSLEPSGHAAATFVGTRPPLAGDVAPSGEIRLRGGGLSLRGQLPQQYDDPPEQAFTGTLGSGQAFSLEIIASYLTQRTSLGPFLDVGSETPVFTAAPWRQLNGRLERFVRTPAVNFSRKGRALAAKGQLDYFYSYENRVETTRLTPQLLSLREAQFFYTGGAHPNTTYRSLTFVREGQREGARVLRVTLPDMFRDGADYEPVLLSEVTRKLRAREAAWIVDDSTVNNSTVDDSVRLTARDLGVFNLTERGIAFTFAPYAVGAYAQGTFEVTVPFGRLRELLEPAFLP